MMKFCDTVKIWHCVDYTVLLSCRQLKEKITSFPSADHTEVIGFYISAIQKES